MRIFGLAGWSGSGKTTLMTKLLPEIIGRGLTVSTVKHAHHAFDVDQPGKDSWLHRQAGATEVMVSSANRWALMHENRGALEASLEDLIRRMSPVDLLLVEGFKRDRYPKIEVHSPALGQPLLCTEDKDIVAVASETPIAGLSIPVFDREAIGTIADFILAKSGLGP